MWNRTAVWVVGSFILVVGVAGCPPAPRPPSGRAGPPPPADVTPAALWLPFKAESWARYDVVTATPAGRQAATMTFAKAGGSSEGSMIIVKVEVPGQAATGGEMAAVANDPNGLRWVARPGRADVTVGGHPYRCIVYTASGHVDTATAGTDAQGHATVTHTGPGVPTESQMWVSSEVPGGIVKLHANQPGGGGGTTQDLILTACHVE